MTTAPVETGSRSPARELLADRNFRRFWIAQVLVFGSNGTARFVFVWLIVTLTDWAGAEGLVAFSLGLPALLLSLPAGAWSDRVERKRFTIVWAASSALVFGVSAIMVALDVMTVGVTAIAAAAAGTASVMAMPTLNALVPALVPPDKLMNAAALQNGGGQAASFLGLGIGGAAIAVFGNVGGFALLACALATATVLMAGVSVPASPDKEGPPTSVRADVAAGLRYGLGQEPRRSLLIVTLILGSSFSAMQIAIPRVVQDDFDKGSTAAGLLIGSFGIGMLISSIAVSRRTDMRHGRNVALFIGIGLGMGQFLLSLAPNYWVAIIVMVSWGVNAGVAIASHRTLLQRNTEPAMMGRVMGIMTLGFAGGLPFGALAQFVLAPRIGPIMMMRSIGLVTMAITIPLLFRPTIRNR